MTPERYQTKPDGSWERWLKGGVDYDTLKYKVNPDNEGVYINGTYVFALAFPTAAKNGKTMKIWNCTTGWQGKGML